MNWREQIGSDPNICHGKPCFTGTRVLVSAVLDCLAAGMSNEEILSDFPSLSTDAIRASLAFSADLAKDQTVAA